MKRWIASKIYTLSLKLENLALSIYDPDAKYIDEDYDIVHTDAGHVIMFPTKEKE